MRVQDFDASCRDTERLHPRPEFTQGPQASHGWREVPFEDAASPPPHQLPAKIQAAFFVAGSDSGSGPAAGADLEGAPF